MGIYVGAVGCGALASPHLAWAYIDPGTGATFIGNMGPLIVGIVGGGFAFLLKIFWHPIKRRFGSDKTKPQDPSSHE
ncbi:hypothetical protein TsocGM_23340 [Tautonia sociabilis]|uniref:Uncharacterized protein n=1 Tax=Tautonia sociabilis TaxID=2080755 RepID=A0A432MD45_9BACT|nr:hypothetical protein TsocGM_23340 [Tautonia sociabilis]